MSRYTRVLGVSAAKATAELATGAEQPEELVMAPEVVEIPPRFGAEKERERLDPRPDLEEDSATWETFLSLALRQDPELGETLKGFRCCGTRLKQVQGKWVLRPDVDPTGAAAWVSVEEYAEAREKFLRPRQKEVSELLEKLTKYQMSRRWS